MARQSQLVTVPSFPGTRNRDLGKLFLITEWPAALAEEWGLRMTLALNKSSGSLPMDLAGIGMEGIAILGINTFLRGSMEAAELIPLLNELLECVRIILDKKNMEVSQPITSPDDIEEVATRLWLRSEVIKLHTNFSPADALSALISSIMTKSPASAST
jgi:hypothetical protein